MRKPLVGQNKNGKIADGQNEGQPHDEEIANPSKQALSSESTANMAMAKIPSDSSNIRYMDNYSGGIVLTKARQKKPTDEFVQFVNYLLSDLSEMTYKRFRAKTERIWKKIFECIQTQAVIPQSSL